MVDGKIIIEKKNKKSYNILFESASKRGQKIIGRWMTKYSL